MRLQQKEITVLLLKLQHFQLYLKYRQGSKMYITDALSRLYTEENHKITDIIPLNFLQHVTDDFIREAIQILCSNTLQS